MIKVNNVSKSFGEFTAVRSVDFQIGKGEVVGLLGPNGAGKTTTMRMMTGFYEPSEGAIEIGGLHVAENPKEVRKIIGYLPENSALYSDMMVCDYLHFIAKSHDLEGEALKKGIEYAVASAGLENYFYRPIHHLSKGYKQRVGIAATLIHNPQVLILDEPTSGLDPNQIAEIQKLIRELAKEKTIILSTHILKEVEETCRRAIIISEGKIVLDDPLEKINAANRGAYKMQFTIKGNRPGAKSDLEERFGGPAETEVLQASEEATSFGLTAETHIGEELFELAVAKGWVIQELYAQKVSLDDIFQKMTGGNS